MKQEYSGYSIQGFWSFPKNTEAKENILKYMLDYLMESSFPEDIELDFFHCPKFQGRDSFWGLQHPTTPLESFCVMGNAKEIKNSPIYLKSPLIPFPGLITLDSKPEHQVFKTHEKGLDNLILHFLYLNDPKSGKDVEFVFNSALIKCGEELSQNSDIKDLSVYRRNEGYVIVAATSTMDYQQFIKEWVRLEDEYKYKSKPDNELIAFFSSDTALYSMGPLKRYSINKKLPCKRLLKDPKLKELVKHS